MRTRGQYLAHTLLEVAKARVVPDAPKTKLSDCFANCFDTIESDRLNMITAFAVFHH